MPVSHEFISTIPDDPQSAFDGKVLPSHWNALLRANFPSMGRSTDFGAGNLPAGTNIDNFTYDEVFQQVFFGFIPPVFTSFLIVGEATSVEVGTTVGGTKSFSFSISRPANVAPNTLDIVDVTTATALASNIAVTSPVSVIVPSFTFNTQGSHSFRARADNTGVPSAQFQSALFTINAYWLKHWGTSPNTTLTENQVEALSSVSLAVSKAGDLSFGTGGYKWFAIPKYLGGPAATTGIRDKSNGNAISMADFTDDAYFSDIVNGWYCKELSMTNAFGKTTDWRVFRSKFPLGGAIIFEIS
jgi:hypothetical protein